MFLDWIHEGAAEATLQMGLLTSYFDGSGKQEREPIVTCVGVAGYGHQTQAFSEVWRMLLAKHQLLDGLTMKRALLAHEPLSARIPAQSIPERIQALMPFAAAIRKGLPLTISIAVDCAAFKAMSVEAKTVLGSKPDFLAFGSAMLIAAQYVNFEKDRMNVVSDDDDGIALQCYRFYRQLKSMSPEFRKKTVALTFADDRAFPQLQAADMLASLFRLHAEKVIHGADYDYGPLLEAIVADVDPNEEIIETHTHLWDRDGLQRLSEGYKKLQAKFPDVTLPSFFASGAGAV